MCAKRRRTPTWLNASLATALVLTAWEISLGTGISGAVTANLGAVLAAVALPVSAQLGLLLGAVLFGLRIRHVVLGAFRRVHTWRTRRSTITLRALPIALEAEIGPKRSPAILRSWLAGLLSALTATTLVVLAWWWAGHPFGRGFALAASAMLVAKLLPRRGPLLTSTGWLLIGLPRMPEPRRSEFRASALAARVHDALHIGDVQLAERHVEELDTAYPHRDATLSCQVSLAEARGEHARAALLLLQRLSEGDAHPREMSYLLAGLAGAAAVAVESGQLPAEELLPTANKAVDDAARCGLPELHLSGTRAVLALLRDEVDEAVSLAARGAEYASSPLSRADDFATLARAHMTRRDNVSARRALERAEDNAAWLPRVRRTRQLLDVV